MLRDRTQIQPQRQHVRSGKRTTLQKGEKTRKFLLKRSPLRAEASLTSLCSQPSPMNIFYVNEYMEPTCTWREKKYYTPSWRYSGDMKEHDRTDMFSYKKCNGIEGQAIGKTCSLKFMSWNIILAHRKTTKEFHRAKTTYLWTCPPYQVPWGWWLGLRDLGSLAEPGTW